MTIDAIIFMTGWALTGGIGMMWLMTHIRSTIKRQHDEIEMYRRNQGLDESQELRTLRQRVDDYAEQVGDLETEVHWQTSGLELRNTEYDKLSEHKSDIQRERNAAQEEVLALREQLQKARDDDFKTIEHLQASADAARKRVEELEASLTEHKNEVRYQTQQHAHYKKLVEESAKRNVLLKKALEKSSADVEEWKAEAERAIKANENPNKTPNCPNFGKTDGWYKDKYKGKRTAHWATRGAAARTHLEWLAAQSFQSVEYASDAIKQCHEEAEMGINKLPMGG